MVSTGDNRSVELDQFPSELINAATVYKTPDATPRRPGTVGHVGHADDPPARVREAASSPSTAASTRIRTAISMRTARTIAVRASGSYVDQFADGKLGVAVGVAYLDSPNQEQHYKSWWWADTAVWGAPLAGTPAGQHRSAGLRSRRRVDGAEAHRCHGRARIRAERDDLRSMLDLYYSKFDQREIRRTLMAGHGCLERRQLQPLGDQPRSMATRSSPAALSMA